MLCLSMGWQSGNALDTLFSYHRSLGEGAESRSSGSLSLKGSNPFPGAMSMQDSSVFFEFFGLNKPYCSTSLAIYAYYTIRKKRGEGLKMIVVQNLTKRFNGKTVLNGVSFQVEKDD